MEEIERIIDNKLLFYENGTLVQDSLKDLAKAIEQYVIKARIEIHQQWRDWAKQPTGQSISVMHSAGISSAVTEIHERADKEIAELNKGLQAKE